jgi:hypothetical protein
MFHELRNSPVSKRGSGGWQGQQLIGTGKPDPPGTPRGCGRGWCARRPAKGGLQQANAQHKILSLSEMYYHQRWHYYQKCDDTHGYCLLSRAKYVILTRLGRQTCLFVSRSSKMTRVNMSTFYETQTCLSMERQRKCYRLMAKSRSVHKKKRLLQR